MRSNTEGECKAVDVLNRFLVGRQNRLVMEVLVVMRVAVSIPVNVTVGCPFVVYAVRVNLPE
jgi:hypothetical protein